MPELDRGEGACLPPPPYKISSQNTRVIIFDNQIITRWFIAGTRLLKTLSGHSFRCFRVTKNLRTTFFLFKLCVAVNFK